MKRILFVDDEPSILDGLQRLLRPMRNEWQTSFVVGGRAALAELEAAPFDVIVSDMRMPDMDGAELLSLVRERAPRVVRIMLSGHADLEAGLRAVPVVHQFLAKPCDASTLQEVVDRACQLQARLDNEAIRQIVGQLGELPSAPEVYLALTEALADPDVSLADLSRIIDRDVAMCAKCLQVVNSAFFAPARRITTIGDAVRYLGTEMLRGLAFSTEAFRAFQPDPKLTSFSLSEMEWHAGLAAAIAARILPDKQRAPEAFLAGMLHDIGRLVLATRLPARLEEIERLSHERGCTTHKLERELLGVTHADIGAYLLGLWGIPHAIVEAVAYHHTPSDASPTTFDLVAAVYVANVLAHELTPPSTGAAPVQAVEELDLSYLERLGVADQLAFWRATAAYLASGRPPGSN